VFLFVILTAQLMVTLDTTIVNVALPHIQSGLHFSASSLSWVLNGYLLVFGGLLLLGARAGDLLGRRRTFLAGIALFALSSLVGGFAADPAMLLAARAVQGIGAALAAPSSLALLTATFPEGPQRVRAIGMFTTVSAAGAAVGLVSGGVLTQLVSWRWVMFVNVPIGVAVLLIGRVALTETATRRGHFDLAGALASTLGMGGIVLGLVQASSDGWTAPATLGPLVGGAALLGAFGRLEARATEPIVPLRLLRNRTRTTANVARGLLYACMYGLFFFLSQYLQDVQGYSPLRAGLSFLPVPISVFLASQLTTRVLVRRFNPKVIMLGGAVLDVVSLLMASQLHVGTPYVLILVELVLLGMGSGSALVSLTTAGLAGVEPAEAGAASGLVNVMQQLGAVLGLAVLVTVFTAAGHSPLGGSASALTPAATQAIVHGLRVTFLSGVLFALAAIALIAALVHLPKPDAVGAVSARAQMAERDASAATEDELIDGEGFEWLDPELVA
jgi:EmrB/QacA subfamily drug resistance transporter